MAPRLLIAYDGSTTAQAAVRVAGRLFPGAAVVVATMQANVAVRPETVSLAVPTSSPELVQRTIDQLHDESRAEAEGIAREGAERARSQGLDAEAVVTGGGATWSAVLELAHARGVDALVCGSRGRGAVARVLLGSTSTSLLHHTDLPLVIVPEEAGESDGPSLLAFDGSPEAHGAIEACGRLLGGRRAVVVHVWEPPPRRALRNEALDKGPADDVRAIVQQLDRVLLEDATAFAERGVACALGAGLEATGVALTAEAGVGETIVAAAREHDAAVIVTGARGLGGARSALLGSVSSGLVHRSGRPVLVVPAASLT